jgi:hypothetical protein
VGVESQVKSKSIENTDSSKLQIVGAAKMLAWTSSNLEAYFVFDEHISLFHISDADG